MRHATSRVSLLLLCAVASHGAAAQANYPQHQGRAPVSFDDYEEPSDTYVVNDADSPDLDIYDYRRGGEFDYTIPVNIRRVVGDIPSLKGRGLLSKNLRIVLPAFDVDQDGATTIDCDGDGTREFVYGEVNEVYFNGELLGTLTGGNQLWNINSFEVPIESVNFPTSPGGVGENLLQIKIDVANVDIPLSGGGVGCKVWATEIDWVAADFEVTSPVIFTAGLFGSPDSFANSGYQGNLRDTLGVPSEIFSHSFLTPSSDACNPTRIPALTAHAQELRAYAEEAAQRFGTSSFHLIGHSMGGLDSRVFINDLQASPLRVVVGEMSGQPVYSELKVASLVTHGSPHAGTLVADFGVALRKAAQELVYGASDICDLTTTVMREVNRRIRLPSDVPTLLIGSDADASGDGRLDAAELTGNQIANETAGNFLYRLLRDNDAVTATYEFDPFLGVYVWQTEFTPSSSVHKNDTQTTIDSSLAAPGASSRREFVQSGAKNHGTIIGTVVQDVVMQEATARLDWRVN
jgi:pimeloyl-ACP methyl ester carboxylesterase